MTKDQGLKEAYTEANQENWTKLELEDYLRASIKELMKLAGLNLQKRK